MTKGYTCDTCHLVDRMKGTPVLNWNLVYGTTEHRPNVLGDAGTLCVAVISGRKSLNCTSQSAL